ncbi:hypothetical protein [Methanooceanicella nereidis]|nr:hypothetical protein [Methanocella sp. CWC-04]
MAKKSSRPKAKQGKIDDRTRWILIAAAVISFAGTSYLILSA